MKKALSISFTLMLGSLCLFLFSCLAQALFTPGSNFGVARIYGHSFLYVATDSMVGDNADSLPQGTGIVIRQVDPASLHQGDVISFYDDRINAINTHRLTEDPQKIGDSYRLHTTGDNASSDHYKYGGETFSDKELIGLVVGHSDALGHFLEWASPTASGVASVRDGKASTAWIFPLLGFSPIVIALAVSLVLTWKKSKKKVLENPAKEALIDELPTEEANETPKVLEEKEFESSLKAWLFHEPHIRSALLLFSLQDVSKKEALLEEVCLAFPKAKIGEHPEGYYAYVSPCYLKSEAQRKCGSIKRKVPGLTFHVSFYPDVSAEDILLCVRHDDDQSLDAGSATPRLPNVREILSFDEAATRGLTMGFNILSLYRISSADDAYELQLTITSEGQSTPKEPVFLSREKAGYLFRLRKGEEFCFVSEPDIDEFGHSFCFYPFPDGLALLSSPQSITLSPEHEASLLSVLDALQRQSDTLFYQATQASQSWRMEALLDHIQGYAYEVNPKTHRLHYVSEGLREKIPSAFVGALCHKALYGSLAPCPRCPLEHRSVIDKALPQISSSPWRFQCISSSTGQSMVLLLPIKSKKESPLSFIETLEEQLRQRKTGLLLILEFRISDSEREYFLPQAMKALDEKGYGAGLYEYGYGLAYLCPNLGKEDAVSLRLHVEESIKDTNPPPRAYYRFVYPTDVSARLELEAWLRHYHKVEPLPCEAELIGDTD